MGGAGMSVREGNAREVGCVGHEGGEERERVGEGMRGGLDPAQPRGGEGFPFVFLFLFLFLFLSFFF
jgi:hypothetical protein